MANWDEDSGYYCLLIAILCNLDVYESILMYKYGPDYPLCQKILKKKVRIENTDKMTDNEVGAMMYRLRKAGYTLEEISNAFHCYPSTVRRRGNIEDSRRWMYACKNARETDNDRFLFFGNLGTETKNTIVCMGKSLYLWRCRKYVYGWDCSE